MRRFAQAESCTQKPWQMVTSGRQSAERTALRATSRTPDPKPSRRTVAKTDTVEQQAPLNKYSWHIRNRTLSSMADPRKAILRTKNIALCTVAGLSNSGARTPRQTEAHGKCRRPDLGDPETHRLGACFPLIGALGSPNLSTASSPPS